jgi:hypothetical protein
MTDLGAHEADPSDHDGPAHAVAMDLENRSAEAHQRRPPAAYRRRFFERVNGPNEGKSGSR